MDGSSVPVEKAVFDHFRSLGWRGYWREGRLILCVLKAASFPQLPERDRYTYVESLYAQAGKAPKKRRWWPWEKRKSFEEGFFDLSWLLDNVRNSTPAQIRRNAQVILSTEPLVLRDGGGTTYMAYMEEFVHDLELWMFLELFDVLRPDRLLAIAQRFSQDPYKYRSGWPDLTLWRDHELKLFEVKAPGDRLQISQRSLIADVILPVGLDCTLVDVFERDPSQE